MARELPWGRRFLENPNSVQVEIGGLQRQLARMAHIFRGTVPEFLRTVCAELLGYFITDTPVDTGQARAGWWASAVAFGVPIESELDQGGNPDEDAQEEGKSQSAHEENAEGAAYSITMTNGVPHIVALEYGHSTQAPRGMVRENIRKFRRHFREALGGHIEETIR